MGWYEHAIQFGEKYMKVLGTKGKMPVFKIADNLGSKWLGICRYIYAQRDNTTITYQKSIVDDPRTYERVAAHEMVHHHNFLNMTDKDIVLARAGVKTDGHGPDFVTQAEKINAVMGKGFVTKTSDAEYVLSQTVKTYFLYMEPKDDGILYGWAVKLSSQAQRNLARRIPFYKGKLVEVNDRRWTNCAGKIGATLTMCRARPGDRPMLEKLYDEGKPAKIMATLAPQQFNVRDLIREEGRPLTELEKKILRRHGHEIPKPKLTDEDRRLLDELERELTPDPPKPPEPKLHKFEPGAKQGKLF